MINQFTSFDTLIVMGNNCYVGVDNMFLGDTIHQLNEVKDIMYFCNLIHLMKQLIALLFLVFTTNYPWWFPYTL